MQKTIRLTTLFCCLLLIAIALAAQTPKDTKPTKTTPATGSPYTALEKDIMTEVNRVRAHPAEYITYLEGLRPYFKGKEFHKGQLIMDTEEGWSAVEDAIQFLRSAKPQPALAISNGLCQACSVFVKEQSGGATGHKGANNSMIEDRVKPYGMWDGAIGENLSYGDETARDRVLSWLIDDGFASRGHRKRILSPDYKVAGVSCGPHAEYHSMCVLTFAGGFSDVKAAKPAAKSSTGAANTNSKKPVRKGVR